MLDAKMNKIKRADPKWEKLFNTPLKLLQICSFPHFSPTCFDILSSNFVYDFVLMYHRASLSVVILLQFLLELCLFVNLEYSKYTVFRTFLPCSQPVGNGWHLSSILHIDTSMTCCPLITLTLKIISVRCIPLNLRSKTRRRATFLLPT